VQQIERDCFSVAKLRSIYIYDVSISGFTRSSIYTYDNNSLRVKYRCEAIYRGIIPATFCPKTIIHYAYMGGSQKDTVRFTFQSPFLLHYFACSKNKK